MTNHDPSDERELALRQAARGYADRKADGMHSPQAQLRRETFRRFLADRGLNRAELARLAGLPTANALHNFLNGRSASLSLPTLEAIHRAVPGATIAEIIGERPPARLVRPGRDPATGHGLTVPLLCNTGIQPDGTELDVMQLGVVPAGAGTPILITVPAIPAADGKVPLAGDLFAVRVTAPGAECLFPLGSLLVCKNAADLEDDLPDGTRVILRCRANGSTRVDIREVRHLNGRIWLWQRSTHPHHQMPQPGPQPLCGSHRVPGGETITILGTVLASWQAAAQPRVP